MKAAAKDRVLKARLITDHTKASNYDLWKAFNHSFNNENSSRQPALVHTAHTRTYTYTDKGNFTKTVGKVRLFSKYSFRT